MDDSMFAARMEFIHAEFRDWFRSKAPERFRTLAIILHDGIRERVRELAGGVSPDDQVRLARLLASIDAEFEAATGFRFEPWGDAPPVDQEIPGGRAWALKIHIAAEEVGSMTSEGETLAMSLTGGKVTATDGREYRIRSGSIALTVERSGEPVE